MRKDKKSPGKIYKPVVKADVVEGSNKPSATSANTVTTTPDVDHKGNVVAMFGVEKEQRRNAKGIVTTHSQADAFKVQERRKNVCELYLLGWGIWEIGRKLEITNNTVHTDLKFIQKLWQEKMVTGLDERRCEELAKIDNLERMASDAYVRSMGVEEVYTEVDETSTFGGKNQRKVTKKQLVGDVRFLDKISWCIEIRCKMFGLLKDERGGNKVNVININWGELMGDGLGGDDINNQILELEAQGYIDTQEQGNDGPHIHSSDDDKR